MIQFFKKSKLIKDDLKGRASLMFKDVSEDPWDQENLTIRNLDFSVESIRYIDVYVNRLLTTQTGQELLSNHYEHFVVRIGAYVGEVIKQRITEDFQWYEADSIYLHSPKVEKPPIGIDTETILYSKENDEVISPLQEVAHTLKGKPTYPTLLQYVEDKVKR
ncbi:hypothetical protein [Bacillus alkalisoli]|uniref:hypothetical protein n=1 Tax=Bacillus alkalisoli TaxID=2011008 RepID=UPI000C2452BD|nr:hypothetical protein [Bacillus alkalisoli]